MSTFKCAMCSAEHPGPALSYFFRAPAQWDDAAFGNRHDCVLEDEVCIIENTFFYIKGNVELPIVDRAALFVWTVWVALRSEDFQRVVDLWHDPHRTQERPYRGLLCSELPAYPSTLNLKAQVHMREPGVRPRVELGRGDHPLAVEQRSGIEWDRVLFFAAGAVHKRSL